MTPAKRRNPCTGKPIGESWWASKYTDREVRQVWLLRPGHLGEARHAALDSR